MKIILASKSPRRKEILETLGIQFEILTANKDCLQNGFLMHCYSESAESAKEYLKLGAYFAFGGAITFKNAKKEDIIRSIPMDRVLCETDCPYMSPVPYRGQTNLPVRVREVYLKMAEVYEIELEKIQKDQRGKPFYEAG